MATFDLHMAEASRKVHMTLRITGRRQMAVRWWLMVQLFRLGAVVGAVGGIEIERAGDQ